MWTRFSCALLVAGCAMAQTPATSNSEATDNQSQTAATVAKPAPESHKLIIPAGTKVPLALKQAISTKSAKEGDPVYCETTFPFVVDDKIVIPAGTYVKGKISQVKRPGRVKGRAELLMHFTSMIYPSGYTVVLPGAVDNMPGAEHTNMKGPEGTVQQEGQKGKDIGTVASTASTGAVIGGLATRSGKGVGVGALSGGLVGLGIAMLSRGDEVRLQPGTSIEMVIQRDISVDAKRVTSRQEVLVRNE